MEKHRGRTEAVGGTDPENRVFGVLARSMPLIGTALFFYIFFQARGLFDTVPGFQETFFLLIVWLFTN
jgi:hypothetical protein